MATTPGQAPLMEPLLPECLSGLTRTDFQEPDATDYNLTSWDYYEEVFPSVVPGIVLGAISLLACLFFLIWMCVHGFCTCGKKGSTESSYQFMSNGEPAKSKPPAKSSTWGTVYMALLALVAIATVGMCIWGIVVSVDNTDSQITNFWELVDNVDEKVNATNTLLINMSSQLEQLQGAFVTIEDSQNEVDRLVSNTGLSIDTNAVFSAIKTANSSIETVQGYISEAETEVQDNIGQAVDDLQEDYRPPSMTFENEGRFVAICILFSLVILLVILATVLSWRVTWPRTAAFMVALLWFFVALLMLLGMGLMNGIYYVSSDTCLYGESFAVQYAYNQVEDPVKREWVVRALLFYLVPDANATATDDPISQVFNIDLKAIDNVLTGELTNGLSAALANPAVVAQANISENVQVALTNAVTLSQNLGATVEQLRNTSSLENVLPLYGQFKSYICCDFSDASDNIWIAWTVVGCLGFVLALMCGARIVYKSRGTRRTQK